MPDIIDHEKDSESKEKILLIVDSENINWAKKSLNEQESARLNFLELRKVVADHMYSTTTSNAEVIKSIFVSNRIQDSVGKGKFYSYLADNQYEVILPDKNSDTENFISAQITNNIESWIIEYNPTIVIIASGTSYFIDLLCQFKNIVKIGVASIDKMISAPLIERLDEYINLEEYRERLIFLAEEKNDMSQILKETDNIKRIELSITVTVESEHEISEIHDELNAIGKKYIDQRISEKKPKSEFKLKVF